MKILINSDSSIAMDARLVKLIMREATELLDRFSDHLTRVEIHLTDIDRGKTGRVDKRCLVEVRVAGMKPIVTSTQTREIETAVNQALRKTVRALNTSLGKQGLLRTIRKPTPVVAPAAVTRGKKSLPGAQKSPPKKAPGRVSAAPRRSRTA
jgi:hypothetical protein